MVEIRKRLGPMLADAQQILCDDLLPALGELGVQVVHYDDLKAAERKVWDRWFQDKVLPILTPLAVGSTHPFPFISNLSLNLALMVRSPSGESRLARVKVPHQNLPRFLPLSGSWDIQVPERVLPLEELIAANLSWLFPGMDVGRPYVFRVTRDADVEIAVDDNGTGVPEDEREAVFERFARGSTASRSGSGLGLALVAQQAEIHGGTAALEDSPLGGTRLMLRLPAPQ